MRNLFDPAVIAIAREFSREWIDALYPPICALCPSSDWGDGLGCSRHRLPLGLAGSRCGRCARALPPSIADGERCSDCRTRAPGFDRLVALADYRAQPVIQDWILALKYGRRPDLARTLGAALGARWSAQSSRFESSPSSSSASSPSSSSASSPSSGSDSSPSSSSDSSPSSRSDSSPSSRSEHNQEGLSPALMVPVPLHALRRLERGYDQALLVARAAGAISGVRVATALRRARATAVQGAPGSPSRTANVDGAFAPVPFATPRVRGSAVWIVDDVVTSGATVAECARVLRRMGAERVSVLALARASS